MEILTMCCIGHRPLNGACDIAHPDRQQIREQLYLIIKRAHINGGFTTFISGMAPGFDTDFALCIIQLRLEMKGGVFLIAAVPFKDQEKAWKKQDQEIYQDLISQSDSVIEICEPGFADWKYQARNIFMIDNSEHILAFWNGSEGEVSLAIHYSIYARKPILNLLAVQMKKDNKKKKDTILKPIEENLRIFQEHMDIIIS